MDEMPCKLCRERAISASGGKWCAVCYKEVITNFALERYPVSGKDVARKLL